MRDFGFFVCFLARSAQGFFRFWQALTDPPIKTVFYFKINENKTKTIFYFHLLKYNYSTTGTETF